MKYSFVVPVYNGEDYIERCLKNLIKQTYTNFEIIVINDGSTDNSKKILEKYVVEHKNKIKLINQENKGLSVSRNIGINNSSGDFILFIDIDDIFHFEGLEKINKNISTKFDLVKFNWTSDKSKFGFTNNNVDIKNGAEALKFLINKKEIFEMAPIYAYRKKHLIKINFEFKKDRYHEDFGAIPLSILKATNVLLLDDYLYYYDRSNENSITMSNDYSKIIKKANDVLDFCVEINNELNKITNIDKNVIGLFKSYNINAVLFKLKTLKKKEKIEYVKKIKNFNLFNELQDKSILQRGKKIYLKLKYMKI